jgi:hypothetical protein
LLALRIGDREAKRGRRAVAVATRGEPAGQRRLRRAAGGRGVDRGDGRLPRLDGGGRLASGEHVGEDAGRPHEVAHHRHRVVAG